MLNFATANSKWYPPWLEHLASSKLDSLLLKIRVPLFFFWKKTTDFYPNFCPDYLQTWGWLSWTPESDLVNLIQPHSLIQKKPKKGPFFEKMAKQHHHRPNPMRDAMLVHTSVLFPQFAKWGVQVFLWESYPPKRVEEGLTGVSL